MTGKIKADGLMPQLFKMMCTLIPAPGAVGAAVHKHEGCHGWRTVSVSLRGAWFRSLTRDAVSWMIGSRAVLPCLLNSELCSSVPASL